MKKLLSRSEKENEKSKGTIKNHFANGCKYEYLFWEMPYNLGA
jgi:thiaminase